MFAEARRSSACSARPCSAAHRRRLRPGQRQPAAATAPAAQPTTMATTSSSPRRSATRTSRTCRSASRRSAPQKLERAQRLQLQRLYPAAAERLVPDARSRASTNVYIRGVASGGDGNHSGSLPSVGVYLDEQPVTTIGGTLDVHIYDIARIEGLRGPAGHAVRRLVGSRHDPHHHQQARHRPHFYGARRRRGQQRPPRRHRRQARRLPQRAAERQRGAARGRLVPARRRLYRQCRRHPLLPAAARAASPSTTPLS